MVRHPWILAALAVLAAAIALGFAANEPLRFAGGYGLPPAAAPAPGPPPEVAPTTAPPAAVAAPTSASPSTFIRVQDGEFVDGCKSWYPVGWNQWEAVEMGAGAPVLWGGSLPAGMTGPELLREIYDSGAQAGFNVVRFLAHGVSKETALQTSPGTYSESAFKGLDYAIAEAGARGLRLILALTSNWGDIGSVDEFVAWSSTAETHDDFFTDAAAKDLFLKHASAVTGRVNAITGVAYRDDPTIFSWNLVNEPRCYKCGGAVRDWVASVAPAVKKLAPRQLVTIGEEGFYGRDSPKASANPGGPDSWAGDEGQDFVADHSVGGIDFWAIHMWPDNWKTPTLDFVKAWIDAHAADAVKAGVPLLVEEHGKWLKPDASEADRTTFYKAVLSEVEASASSGGPIKGSLFWSFQHPGQEAPRSEGGGRGLYGVRPGDAAFRLAAANAKTLTGLAKPLPGCTGALDGPTLARPGGACLDTRVRGLPRTGREGPACATDINECVRGTHDCAGEAGEGCVNEDGGFRCTCRAGYLKGGEGEGAFRCVLSPGLATIRDAYTSDGPGKAQCGGGPLLPWPPSAPGARPDPLDQERVVYEPYGTISLQDCLLGCEASPQCVVADYNPTVRRCRLRGAGGGRDTCAAREPDSTETDQSLEPQVFENGAWESFFRKEGAGRVGGGGDGVAS